jgi:hypothetical protein
MMAQVRDVVAVGTSEAVGNLVDLPVLEDLPEVVGHVEHDALE